MRLIAVWVIKRKCEMLERDNKSLEREKKEFEYKYNKVIEELRKQLKASYSPFVKVKMSEERLNGELWTLIKR